MRVGLLAIATVLRSRPPQGAAFSETSLEELRQMQQDFVEEREWSQFHTPRSLALALVGEVGEVCELLQWRGDDGAQTNLPSWTQEERMALADELADVMSYVVRLADVTGIDLPAAFEAKLAKNRAKYPSDIVRGSAAKYTEYRRQERATDTDEKNREGGTVDDAFLRAEARVAAQQRAYARAEARASALWAARQEATSKMGEEVQEFAVAERTPQVPTASDGTISNLTGAAGGDAQPAAAQPSGSIQQRATAKAEAMLKEKRARSQSAGSVGAPITENATVTEGKN